MEAAGPKIEFFTPATFKQAAEHVRGQLVHGTGFDWQAPRISKSQRKLGGGSQELFFEAKLLPADKHKLVDASVTASMETAGTQMRILTTVRVEKNFKAVFEATHEPKTFQEAQQWFSHVAIPAHALEEVKTASYDYGPSPTTKDVSSMAYDYDRRTAGAGPSPKDDPAAKPISDGWTRCTTSRRRPPMCPSP